MSVIIAPVNTNLYSGRTVDLSTSDGKEHKVPIEVANMSTTLKNMLEEFGTIDAVIPLSNINDTIMQKVIIFCKHLIESPSFNIDTKDKKNSKTYNNITKWDEDFFNVDQLILFEIILAANYLDIIPLLDKSCGIIAKMIEGNTPEEIRNLLNIKNDFTPEEEKKVIKENEWLKEK